MVVRAKIQDMRSVLDPPDLQIWDRQQDEPPNAWFAFRRWRDGKPRPTFVALADDCDVSPPTISTWAAAWGWKARALEYDRMVDSGVQDAVKKTEAQSVEDMRAQHLNDAGGLRRAALDQLRRLDEGRPSLQAAVRAIDVATKLERLTHGQATEIREAVDYSRLSDAEIESLMKLLEKAEGKDE